MSLRFSALLFAQLLFILYPLQAFAQETVVLTLENAIQTALDNNFSLKQAENNLELSDHQVTSAYADLMPSLSGGISGNRNTGRQFIQEDLTFEDRTTYGISGNLSTNIPIFSGFQNINNLRRSKVNRNQELASFQRIRENIIFNTAMRYLQVLLDRELLEISNQTLETSILQLEQIEAQVDVGARPIVDLYQQESVVAGNELSVVQAENALDLSHLRLIRMLQIDVTEELEFVVPEIDDAALLPRDLELDELLAIALEQRSDLEAQRYQIESSRYSLYIARASRFPSISFSAGMGTRYSDQYSIPGPTPGERIDVGFGEQFFDQMISRSASFSVSIPLFNRLNTATSIAQAEIQYRNAQLTLDDTRFQVREEVRQAYNDYTSLSKELEATERSLRAAERAFETQEQRYEIGAATLIELNQATTTYTEALSSRQRAVYNFIFQERLLDYYIGILDESLSF
ncbi:MAG: TolC family protein [Balneolaceae bacterium]